MCLYKIVESLWCKIFIDFHIFGGNSERISFRFLFLFTKIPTLCPNRTYFSLHWLEPNKFNILAQVKKKKNMAHFTMKQTRKKESLSYELDIMVNTLQHRLPQWHYLDLYSIETCFFNKCECVDAISLCDWFSLLKCNWFSPLNPFLVVIYNNKPRINWMDCLYI